MKDADLDEIRWTLKYVDMRRLEQKKSRKSRLKNVVNKKYKKLPWHKKSFKLCDIKDCLVDTSLPCLIKLRAYNYLRTYKLHEDDKFVECNRNNVENLFFLQELMCSMDDDFWFKQEKKKRNPVKHIPFYYNSKYLGKIFIGSFPKSLEWKQEILNDFLKDKEYIFDERTPYGRPLSELKQFLGRTLIKSSVEKWDYYFKRFLAENTK